MMGPYWVPKRESVIVFCSIDLLHDALCNGYSVVIDNMNLSEKSTKDFHEVCQELHVSSIYKDFKTPLNICIERDSKREHPVGEKVIRAIYERNKAFYNED